MASVKSGKQEQQKSKIQENSSVISRIKSRVASQDSCNLSVEQLEEDKHLIDT